MQKTAALLLVMLCMAISCQSAVPTLPPGTATPIVLQVQPLQFDHPFEVRSTGELQAQVGKWQFLADPADELSVNELTAPPKNLGQLTRAQAEEDVRYLFRLLKHGYAGYGAFDANGNFDRAQANILQALSSQQTVSKDALATLIQSNLAFIFDCHLRIAGNTWFQHLDYYYWDGLYFFKDGERFWTWAKDGKNWLESVNSQPPSEYLKLSLTNQGDPVYQLGTLAPKQPENFTLDLVRADGTHDTRKGTWVTSPFSIGSGLSSLLGQGRTVFSRSTEQGVAVIVNRQLAGNEADLRKLVNDAASLRDEPIFILDLRGNGGGNSQWAEDWVTKLTGRRPQWPFTDSELQTRTAFAGKVNLSSLPGNSSMLESYRSTMNDLDEGLRRRGWTPLQIPRFSIIPNPRQLVVVLTDRGIASSGEAFLGYLRQLDHVVFVGENSRGCGLFGDITSYTLPHSGMAVQLNYKLFLPADLTNTEGKGYMPDLWVPASQALPYTLAAIKKGWLQPPQ